MENLLKGKATCQLRSGIIGCSDIIQNVENGGTSEVYLLGINDKIMIYSDADKTNAIGPLKFMSSSSLAGGEIGTCLDIKDVLDLVKDEKSVIIFIFI